MITIEQIKFGEVQFTIGDPQGEASATENLSMKDVYELSETLSSYVTRYESWLPYIEYYKDFPKKIEKVLTSSFMDYDGEVSMKKYVGYEVGANYALFLGAKTDSGYCNNHEATCIIKKMYRKEYGTDEVKKLNFDSEMSRCYIKIKRKADAKKFLLWVYRTIIKSKMDELLK